MITEKILLNNIESVNRFVNKMTEKDFDVDLKCGKYLVNAKSIMGVLSLDLTQEVTVEADTLDQGFLKEIEEYKAEK